MSPGIQQRLKLEKKTDSEEERICTRAEKAWLDEEMSLWISLKIT